MTGKQIIDFFKSLVDDQTIDDDLALNLANTAKGEIEEERGWRMLFTKNTSNSITSGHSYDTPISLPDDFNIEHKIALVNSSGDEDELDPFGYEDLVKYKDHDGYVIDYANSNLYITGTVENSETIHIYYFKFTDDITLTTEPVWPTRFHKVIAYRMAEIWLEGIDADDLTRLQWPAHKKAGDKLFKAMVRWDARLWAKSMDNRAGMGKRRALRTDVIDELA